MMLFYFCVLITSDIAPWYFGFMFPRPHCVDDNLIVAHYDVLRQISNAIFLAVEPEASDELEDCPNEALSVHSEILAVLRERIH